MKIAIILTAADKASRVVNATVGKIQKNLSKFSTGAMVAGGLGTAFFAASIKAAEESEISQNKLRQVFKSMGLEYNNASQNAIDYANTLQNQIYVEDEAIMAVQAKLATFKNATDQIAQSNDIFNRTTRAAFDLQALGFGDAMTNIVQLGKAINEPAQLASALRKVGTLSDDDIKRLKVITKTQGVLKAQLFILNAIKKQSDKQAALSVTDAQKMRIAWGEAMEKIGTVLMPLFTRFANYMLNTVIPAVTGFIEKHPGLVKFAAIGSAALLAIGAAAKVVTVAFNIMKVAVMTNPILLIIGLIAMAVYLVIRNWSKIKAFFSRLWDVVENIFSKVWKAIKFIALAPFYAIKAIWGTVSGFFSDLWNGLVSVASKIWNAIGDAITAPIKWIKEKWEELVGWIEKTWKKIKGFFTGLFGSTIPDDMYEKALKAQGMMQSANNGWQVMQKYLVVNPATSPVSPAAAAAPVPVSMGGNKNTFSINVTNNISGADAATLPQTLQKNNRDLAKQIEEAQRRKDRTKF